MKRIQFLLATSLVLTLSLMAMGQTSGNSVLLQPAAPPAARQEVLPLPPPSPDLPPIVTPTDDPSDLDRESDWRFHEIELRIKKAEERLERDLTEAAKLRREAFEKNDEKIFRRAERAEREALERYTRTVREFERTDPRNFNSDSRTPPPPRNNSRNDRGDDDDDDRKKDDEKKKKRRFRLWPFGR